jgi:hypothetical protein
MTPVLVREPVPLPENVLPAVVHELRQPLSAIESIAHYFSLLHGVDKQRQNLGRIQQLVEQSNWILSSGLALVDMRPPEPEAVDLRELIVTRAVPDPSLEFMFEEDLPLVHLDPGFGRTLMETLLCLFRQLSTAAHRATVRAEAAARGVEIELSTSAPGYRSLAALPPGSSLCLDCARRISKLHGGTLNYSIDPLTGIRVLVMLP